jgi:hypothetical protein
MWVDTRLAAGTGRSQGNITNGQRSEHTLSASVRFEGMNTP